MAAGDSRPRPENWQLSPPAVVTYLLGGKAPDGTEISAKYVGNGRLIETAVATLDPPNIVPVDAGAFGQMRTLFQTALVRQRTRDQSE